MFPVCHSLLGAIAAMQSLCKRIMSAFIPFCMNFALAVLTFAAWVEYKINYTGMDKTSPSSCLCLPNRVLLVLCETIIAGLSILLDPWTKKRNKS